MLPPALRFLATLVVAVLLWLPSPAGAGQNRLHQVDSLRAVLHQPNLPDTLRVRALADLSAQINRTDMAEAEKLARQALTLARQLRYRRGEAMALNAMAATAFYAGDNLTAQRYFTECLSIATKTGIKRLQGHAYLGLGNVAGSDGDLPRAIGYYEQARRSYAACSPPNLSGEALALNNIAGHLLSAGRLQEADRLLRKALVLARRIHSLDHELWSLNNLGRLQQLQHHQDSAFVTWREARRKAHSNNDYHSEVLLLLNEAGVLIEDGKAAQALPLAQEAARLARTINSAKDLSWALNHQAEAMRLLGQVEAYDVLQTARALRDSLDSEERTKTIAQLQVQFDVKQQQAHIKVLEQQRRITQLRAERQEARTRFFIFLTVGLLLIVVGGALLIGLLMRSRRRLQTSEAALRQANDTKEQLMRIIGHDLRAPVASFQQLTPLLHEVVKQPDPTDAHELIRLLDAGSQQLGALVDNLLHWTRVRSGLVASRPATLQLAPVATGIAALYEPVALLKGVRLERAFPPTLTVWADQDLLATVLRNLLSNAIKFTPSGGTVWLKAAALPEAVELEVRDSGVGMTADRLATLFTEERTASTPGTNGEPGTGLGLPLCARFVRLMGSELKVESAPGAGTRFWFRLTTAPTAIAAPHRVDTQSA